jgi:hypothetical protein
MNASRHALVQSQATAIYHLEVFGDYLAKREGYKEHSGFDALFYYLIQTITGSPHRHAFSIRQPKVGSKGDNRAGGSSRRT